MFNPLAQRLQEFAAEVHFMAYQEPQDRGEFALLKLSQRMHTEAEHYLHRSPSSVQAVVEFPASER